jgi:outer membrane protein assembly factor BamB
MSFPQSLHAVHRRLLSLLGASLVSLFLIGAGRIGRAQVSLLTQHNNNSRTGANLNETILTPARVNTGQFGRLFTINVNGQIYAQPLYVPHVTVPGQGVHNVLYVATMHNYLYALDADTGAQLWSKYFGNPVPASDVQCCCPDVSDQIGILGTPVINPLTNTIFFVSRNKNGNGTYHQRLNALSITDGAPRPGSPAEIQGAYGGLTFDPKIQNQRAALTLANGNVYIAWASHNDCGPYHGWVMAYSTASLSQVAVYANTPTGSLGGIWQSGQGLVVDAAGNLYFSGGNGSYSPDGTNVGNSFVKLSPTLQQLDWFTPYNSDNLNAADADLGSAGLLALPNTHYIVGGGKQGVLYLVDTANMGKFHSGGDQVVQSFQAIFGVGSSHIHGTPIYYNSPSTGPTLYIWGENDYLRAYAYSLPGGHFNTTPIAKSSMTAPIYNANGAMPGGFLTLSANGSQPHTAIVWATTPYDANANNAVVRGIVHAFDADTLQELWNDKQSGGADEIGNFAKFCPPTVANGKVYIASFGQVGSANGSGALLVYGLRSTGQRLTPVADAYVQSGAAANRRYGTLPLLGVEYNPPDFTRYSYLRFDISGLSGAISAAKLRLYGSHQGSSTSSDSCYGVSDITWSETGIAWSNKPTLGAKLSSASVTRTSAYYEWDVTSYLQAQKAAGKSAVTLAVTMDALPPDGAADVFNSREAGQNTPQLAISSIPLLPNYPGGFGQAAGLVCNGSAFINGNSLELTDGGSNEAGSVFFYQPVNIAAFTTTFQFQLTNPNADGFTFTVQGVGATALGGAGGSLGYGPVNNTGVGIGQSAAVKFDLYNNSGEGANSTGLFTNGAMPTTPANDLTASGINLHSGDIFQVTLNYNGTTLAETILDTQTNAVYTTSYQVNLSNLIGGNAGYVGFTGGTGGLTAVQDILSWTYTNN